ncbi:hypothetical protein ACUTUE_10780 [Bacillus sp. NA_146.1]
MEKEIYGFKFNITIEIDGNRKKITAIPNPEKTDRYNLGNQIFSNATLDLLWNKHYFGIEHNTSTFEMLYNSYQKTLSKEDTIHRILLQQQLFCDMIIRCGIIVEEFAAICTSIEKFVNHNTDIAESYLAASNPIAFYDSIRARGSQRIIKKIFGYPQAKYDSRRIFSNLSDTEAELIWKGVNASVDYIKGILDGVSEVIHRNTSTNFTLYDMYNKLKHAFAPIYPFTMPAECTWGNVPLETIEEDLIKTYCFNSVTIMHDKLRGQRTAEEQQKFENQQLATPTLTQVEINPTTIESMYLIIKDIETLYSRLVETLLAYSYGSKRLGLTVKKDALTDTELTDLLAIVNDDARYISENNQE